MTFDNQQEAQVLINLLDLAVKQAGLGVAEAAVHFQKKIAADFPTTGAVSGDAPTN